MNLVEFFNAFNSMIIFHENSYQIMKKFVIISLIVTANFGKAQFKTQEFVDNIPMLPTEICKIKTEERNAFLTEVNAKKDEINAQIKKTKSLAKPNENQAKEMAISQMQSQYGLSDEEAKKMKSGKMSAQEKKALADKMMMQQTNISMGELQNLKKMSKEGKKEWGKAYSSEAYAMAQANATTNTNDAGNSTELMKQLQALNAKIQQRRAQIQQEYQDFENNSERLEMLQKIKSINSQISSLGGANGGQGAKIDSLTVALKSEKEIYCETFSPMYQNILKKEFADIKNSYTDYYRVAELNRLLVNSLPVKTNASGGEEIEYFIYIQNYLEHLSSAFNYNLKREDED